MTEPWFDPNAYSWIPGTVLGVAAGVFGGVVGGYLAPRGKARRLALSIHIGLIIVSALLLIAGVGVWYGLGLAGVIGVLVLGVNLPTIIKVYQKAEQRRIAARNL